MRIVSGVDLVYLPRFKKALQNGGENFRQRVFNEQELTQGKTSIQHLAGIFSAKEAVIKALSLPVDSWHDIHIRNDHDGAPTAEIVNCKLKIVNCSLSISHDGNYVIAQFMGILK